MAADPVASRLNLTPEIVYWPATHYVFVEKVGPFQTNAPQAWKELHELVGAIAQTSSITGYFSLYKMDQQIYRAGVSVTAQPSQLPGGLRYEQFPGGKFSRFVYTGPYSGLGQATGRLVEQVSTQSLPLRDDYNIENYVNDPRTTPEDQLITEILFPTE